MKKALKIISIAGGGLLGIFLLLALIAPKNFKVERSITINASHAAVLSNIKSLKKMDAWSPWSDYDPDMKVTYLGNDGEPGSASEWEGNDKVGKGRQELISVADNKIETKLTFIEPWESEATGYFHLSPKDNTTDVTWGLTGENSFPWGALSFFMDMDASLGKDFEKGLARLKTVSETTVENKGIYRGYEIREIDMEARTYVMHKGIIAFDKIAGFYGEHLPQLFNATAKAGLQPASAPSGLFFKWDEQNMTAEMAAAVAVSGNNADIKEYEKYNLPAGKALQIDYYGAYDKSAEAHYAMDDYMKERNLAINGAVVEEYITDPSQEPDTAKWLTRIYYPVK